MNLNKIKEASKDNVLLDSEGNNLFVGDIVAYCKTKEYGGGFKVKKDIIKEIRKDTKKVKLLDSKYLTYANCVLKISGIASKEELDDNEKLVKTTINNEKEKIKQQRKEKITIKNIIIAYSTSTDKFISGLEVFSNPGKSINLQNILDSISNFKRKTIVSEFYVYSTKNTFIPVENITHVSDIYLLSDRKTQYIFAKNNYIQYINFPYNDTDKKLIENFINSKIKRYINSSTEEAQVNILKNILNSSDHTYNKYSFFKFTNLYNESAVHLLFDDYYNIYHQMINEEMLLIAFKNIFKIQ